MPSSAVHSRYQRQPADLPASGKIVRDRSLEQSDAFVYRVYAEQTGVRRPLDGPMEGFSPHPTGTPDGSAPTISPANLVVMEAWSQVLDALADS